MRDAGVAAPDGGRTRRTAGSPDAAVLQMPASAEARAAVVHETRDLPLPAGNGKSSGGFRVGCPERGGELSLGLGRRADAPLLGRLGHKDAARKQS